MSERLRRPAGRHPFVPLTGLLALIAGAPSGGVGLVQAQASVCTGQSAAVSPALTDLESQIYVRMDDTITAFTGGLYPGGSNSRPEAHNLAGLAVAASVVPRDSSGSPDAAGGKIVFTSVGMSNTASEFRTLRDAALNDSSVNPRLVLVNGATAGRTAEYWTDPYTDTWQLVDERLAVADLTPAQVQVAWVKLTRTGGGPFLPNPKTFRSSWPPSLATCSSVTPTSSSRTSPAERARSPTGTG